MLGETGAVFVDCVVSREDGTLLQSPTLKTAGFSRSEQGEMLLSEVLVRVKDYFAQIPHESLQRKEFLEEGLAAVVQRYLRSETGRRPAVVCSINVL